MAALRSLAHKNRVLPTDYRAASDRDKLTGSDRGFALELFYGVLRNLTLLDFWIGCLRPAAIWMPICAMSCGSAFISSSSSTLRSMRAVYETVELAPPKQRGLINGVLRSAAAPDSDELREGREPSLCRRIAHIRISG